MASDRGNTTALLRTFFRRLLRLFGALFTYLSGRRLYVYEWELQPFLQNQPIDDQLAADLTEAVCRGWYPNLCPVYKGFQLGELLIDRMATVTPGVLSLTQRRLQAERLLEKILLHDSRKGIFLSIARKITPDHLIMSQLARQSGWYFLFLLGESALKNEFKTRTQLKQKSTFHEGNPYMICEEQLLSASAYSPILQRDARLSIVVIASLNNYLNPMLPVIQTLQDRDYSVIVVVPRRGSNWANVRRLLDMRNTNLLFLEDMVSSSVARAISDYAQQCEQAWATWQNAFRQRMQVKSIDLWDAIEFPLRNTVIKQLPVCAGYFEIADALYTELQPVCVLAAQTRRAFEQTFFMRAQEYHIPTVRIVHGQVGNLPTSRFYNGRFRYTTAVATWGKFQSEEVRHFVSSPFPLIVATGNPQWDALTAHSNVIDSSSLRRNITARVGLAEKSSSNKHWFLFLTQYTSAGWFEEIVRNIGTDPDVLLLVKVHPHEDPAYYAAIVRKTNSHAVVIPHGVCDLWDLLLSSDIVMTQHSTAGFEALLAKKPLITVDFSSSEKRASVDLGIYGLPVARDSGMLRHVVERIVSEPAYGQRLVRGTLAACNDLLANSNVPSATRSVVDLIEYLVGGSTSKRN